MSIAKRNQKTATETFSGKHLVFDESTPRSCSSNPVQKKFSLVRTMDEF